MPRSRIDYSNTIIYKIVCRNISITDLYIGHTTSFKDRKKEHKSRCNKLYPFPIYKTINDNGGWDNWDMVEIEKFSCADANEARARERYWFEELSARLNARCPTLNIENKKEKAKIYLHNYNKSLSPEKKRNKIEYGRVWKRQKFVCDCGSIISNGCKVRHFKTDKHISYIKDE